MSKKFIKDRPPKPTDLCAVAPISMQKVASLLFDKIYVPTIGASSKEDSFAYETVPEEITFGLKSTKEDATKRLWNRFESVYDQFKHLDTEEIKENQYFKNMSIACASKSIAESLIEQGIQATPIYPSEIAFSGAFPEGENMTYQAAINNLPLVTNDSLAWDEVLEFRNDQEAIRKYRAFRLWLSDAVKAKTLNQAQDLIAKRLEEYEWAINTTTPVT